MPIPPFDANGLLPAGVHDATLAEVGARLGRFQRTDRRVRLFSALARYVAEARASELVDGIIVDGSFVTALDDPGDVDVIVVLRRGPDVGRPLRPDQYNVVSPDRVERRHALDVKMVRNGSVDLEDAVEFFGRVRGQRLMRKGLVRIAL